MTLTPATAVLIGGQRHGQTIGVPHPPRSTLEIIEAVPPSLQSDHSPAAVQVSYQLKCHNGAHWCYVDPRPAAPQRTVHAEGHEPLTIDYHHHDFPRDAWWVTITGRHRGVLCELSGELLADGRAVSTWFAERSRDSGFLMPAAIHATLLSSVLTVPNELLDESPSFPLSELFRPRTPEEIAAGEARRAAATAAVQAAYRAVLADAGAHRDATAVTVLELHRPSDDGRWCKGCDGGPDDSGEWPCRTTLTVGRLLGVEVPGDPWSDGYRGGDGLSTDAHAR